MKRGLIAAFLFVSACGSSPSPEEIAQRDKEQAEFEAKYAEEVAATNEAVRGLDRIAYPECPTVWENKKATTCGAKVFEITMSECRSRIRQIANAKRNTGDTPSLLDEGAGPSWIEAAGSSTILSDADRLHFMEGDDKPSPLQFLAVALGDGTRRIQGYNCSMENLRLDGVSIMGSPKLVSDPF